MLDFVGQAGVQKLAGALQSNVRESEAATLFLHEVAVSVLDDFTGLGPLCESFPLVWKLVISQCCGKTYIHPRKW